MKTSIDNLTLGQAYFALTELVRQGAVRQQQVDRQLSRMPAVVADMEARLAALKGAAPAAKRRVTAARSRDPKVVASRALQGRYMGLLRHAAPSVKARAQALCKRMGRERAVEFLLDHQS